VRIGIALGVFLAFFCRRSSHGAIVID
jgi:hypothetical protein